MMIKVFYSLMNRFHALFYILLSLGNEFSSLEGIEFEWNIVPLSPNKDIVLRYITFRDSPYETPPAISTLENEGKKGYSILLEGVKSGAAKVYEPVKFILKKLNYEILGNGSITLS